MGPSRNCSRLEIAVQCRVEGVNVNQSQKSHHHRDDLPGEHRLGDTGQAVFAVAFFVVWVTDTFVLRWTTFLNEAVPVWLRTPAGFVLLVIAGMAAVSTMKTVFG